MIIPGPGLHFTFFSSVSAVKKTPSSKNGKKLILFVTLYNYNNSAVRREKWKETSDEREPLCITKKNTNCNSFLLLHSTGIAPNMFLFRTSGKEGKKELMM